jgi:hypothetical protein
MDPANSQNRNPEKERKKLWHPLRRNNNNNNDKQLHYSSRSSLLKNFLADAFGFFLPTNESSITLPTKEKRK